MFFFKEDTSGWSTEKYRLRNRSTLPGSRSIMTSHFTFPLTFKAFKSLCALFRPLVIWQSPAKPPFPALRGLCYPLDCCSPPAALCAGCSPGRCHLVGTPTCSTSAAPASACRPVEPGVTAWRDDDGRHTGLEPPNRARPGG